MTYPMATQGDVDVWDEASKKVNPIVEIKEDNIDITTLDAGYYYLPEGRKLGRLYYQLYSNGSWSNKVYTPQGPLYFTVYNDWDGGNCYLTMIDNGEVTDYRYGSVTSNRKYWKEQPEFNPESVPNIMIYDENSSYTPSPATILSPLTIINYPLTMSVYMDSWTAQEQSLVLPRSTIIHGSTNKIITGAISPGDAHAYIEMPDGTIYDILGCSSASLLLSERPKEGGSGEVVHRITQSYNTSSEITFKGPFTPEGYVAFRSLVNSLLLDAEALATVHKLCLVTTTSYDDGAGNTVSNTSYQHYNFRIDKYDFTHTEFDSIQLYEIIGTNIYSFSNMRTTADADLVSSSHFDTSANPGDLPYVSDKFNFFSILSLEYIDGIVLTTPLTNTPAVFRYYNPDTYQTLCYMGYMLENQSTIFLTMVKKEEDMIMIHQ